MDRLEYCEINMHMYRENRYFYLLTPGYNLALYPGAPSKLLYLQARDKMSKAAINRTPDIRVGQIIQIKDILTKIETLILKLRLKL